MRSRRNKGGALVIAGLAIMLASAAPASAGTVRYTVAPNPQFAIQDNGNGIVKVSYSGCVTAGQRQTLTFEMSARASNEDAEAAWKVLKEEGGDSVSTFDPATVFLPRNQEVTQTVSLSFDVPSANNGITTFRIKLDPATGEGLGEGAGIMVRIPCVLAAPSGGAAPTTPTAGEFPAPASAAAAGPSLCVATPRRLRIRAGELNTIRVLVQANGQGLNGAMVRIVGAGVSKVKRTGPSGVAELLVRPRRTGTLVVQSDACFGADRLAVRGVATSHGNAAPQFTG